MAHDVPFTVLVVGGSDPTGGAGIQGDLRTLAAHGVHPTAVVAALTAQNHRGVHAVADVGADLVVAQVEAVLAQVAPRAVKTGMLLAPETAAAVAQALGSVTAPLVVDPVLGASAGGALARPGLPAALAAHLFPRAAVVTPNLDEAAVVLGGPVAPGGEAEAAARLRATWRCGAVLLKGGHGVGPLATDWLATADRVLALSLPRLAVRDGHGSGCALATSLAARLGRGEDVATAAAGAKAYLHRALAAARPLGIGRGPVRHDVPVDADTGRPTVGPA
ncbi:MAG: bifunctional hydroxymethylpyrimidine kinase/phosphomethylpyrimidine kinase [Planctomycetes bacterium]|nr:bifunctional hydroxymethylpyrimidine kinase/phosphomethylpyrimidine kinase [Planctomycetota bacterium]